MTTMMRVVSLNFHLTGKNIYQRETKIFICINSSDMIHDAACQIKEWGIQKLPDSTLTYIFW